MTLFRIKNGRLHRGWAEEDYFARKRQLAESSCDIIKAPHPAPWDASCEVPDAEVEAVAGKWLTNPASWADAARIDEISAVGPRFTDLVAIETIVIDQLFSAGQRGAFHLCCSGRYRGGFTDINSTSIGQPVTLRLAGLFDVRDGQVSRVQVTADRLGLNRSLMGPK